MIYNYSVIAQKLPLLKQGLKTINAEFIRTRALSQLSFVQFRPYVTSIPGPFLSLTLMSRSKKTLETSVDLTPSFKTSFHAKVEGLVSNVDYLENRRRNFIQRNVAEKDVCHAHTFCSVDCNFSFCMDFLHR